jgi:hypothetical protein
MTNVEKFRPGSAIASGWVLILFFAGFIVQSTFYGGNLVATAAICSAGIIGSYLLFLKPYVLIFDEGIKIVNPTKEITATWDLLKRSKPSTACPSLSMVKPSTPGRLPLQVVVTVEECTKLIFFPALMLREELVTLLRVTREFVRTSPSCVVRISLVRVLVNLRSAATTS